MKRFDAEQLTRFKEYTETHIANTKADLKSGADTAFDETFSLLNTLNDQADLIQQHIDAGTDKEQGEPELTPAQQKKAAAKAAKLAEQTANQ